MDKSVNHSFMTCPQCNSEESLEIICTGDEEQLKKSGGDAKLLQIIRTAIVANCSGCGFILDGYELVDFLEHELLYQEGE